MEEKNVDITNFLVVAFIVMVGVLIAKVATDFSQIKTSSYSRASEKKTISALKISKQKNVATPCGINQQRWFDKCISKLDITCRNICGITETHDNTSYEKKCVPKIVVVSLQRH